MSDASLYYDDILAWSEEQAAALRRLSVRAPRQNDVDFENVIEEIAEVGRSQLLRAQSYLRVVLAHMVKLSFAARGRANDHWRHEIFVFRGLFADALTASIRARLDIGRAWADACREAEGSFLAWGEPDLPDLPAACPVDIAALADINLSIDDLVERVRAAARIRPR